MMEDYMLWPIVVILMFASIGAICLIGFFCCVSSIDPRESPAVHVVLAFIGCLSGGIVGLLLVALILWIAN
jgi:hypothetical protein